MDEYRGRPYYGLSREVEELLAIEEEDRRSEQQYLARTGKGEETDSTAPKTEKSITCQDSRGNVPFCCIYCSGQPAVFL